MPNILSRVLGIAALAAGLVAVPAQAFLIIWDIDLSGPQEQPPNNSPATGEATITVDTILNTMRLETTFSGLLGPTTAAHIHCCTAVPLAGAAGVATTTPTFPNFPLNVMAGSYDMTFNMLLASSFNPNFVTAHGGNTTQAWFDLLNGMTQGRTYLNIHTATPLGFPGGEIRAFLPVAVPEPGTLALLGIAALGLGWRRRRA